MTHVVDFMSLLSKENKNKIHIYIYGRDWKKRSYLEIKDSYLNSSKKIKNKIHALKKIEIFFLKKKRKISATLLNIDTNITRFGKIKHNY